MTSVQKEIVIVGMVLAFLLGFSGCVETALTGMIAF